MIEQPISVYVNWASYDELSDNIELTEELAMTQLRELLRLRQEGVRFDYYLMDCFWYAPDGGYRTWRKPHWPDGPDRWLNTCLENDVVPGLWVATNSLAKLECIPEWRDSVMLSARHNGVFSGALCLFYGGYLNHFMDTLRMWAERGVRLFKFDFANFNAAPEVIRRTMLPSEIVRANILALQAALKALRQDYPDVVLLAYNGFTEGQVQERTDLPLRKAVDVAWLEVFDALYCGDPRPSDVPTMNFWRSKDLYSDHMVQYYYFNDIAMHRIDNSGFMIGKTGTCYYRGKTAWKGMLILSLARGGWANTYYGNLDLLNDDDAVWFAQVQKAYLDLQRKGVPRLIGGLPGHGAIHGFAAVHDGSGLITVVNPGQQMDSIVLPETSEMRVIFHDSGVVPTLRKNTLRLGGEQLAVIGVGDYAALDWGQEPDVRIAQTVTPMSVEFTREGDDALTAQVDVPAAGRLRVMMQQFGADGLVVRSSGGSPPDGMSLANILKITATQNGVNMTVQVAYDKAIWSGLSWAVGEIDVSDLDPAHKLNLRCTTSDQTAISLRAQVYCVDYDHIG